jgi:hypothetical protein
MSPKTDNSLSISSSKETSPFLRSFKYYSKGGKFFEDIRPIVSLDPSQTSFINKDKTNMLFEIVDPFVIGKNLCKTSRTMADYSMHNLFSNALSTLVTED